MTQDSAPVFIGGTNGSGTRVYAELLEAAGVFQGNTKNFAFEPQDIIQYTRPLVPELMGKTRGPIYDLATLPTEERATTERWLEGFADQLKSEMPEKYSRWGWKHPRNIFLAPFLHAMFKGCYFVHVIRDGRDMSLAGNKGDFLTMNQRFSKKFEDTPAGASGFWSDINCAVSEWCTAQFGRKYIYSRFEDLCENPEKECKRILLSLDMCYNSAVNKLCSEFVQIPKTIGRWQKLDQPQRDLVIAAAKDGLIKFGYLD